MNTTDIDKTTDKENTKKKLPTVEQMIEYMEEKYDDEFEYYDSFGGSATRKNCLLISEKYPDDHITASFSLEDGQIVYRDNYTHCRYREDTEKYLKDMLEKHFGVDVIISYSPTSTGTVNNFTYATSFEEFVMSVESVLDCKVVVSEKFEITDKSKILSEIEGMISESGLKLDLDIYFAKDENTFKSYDDMTLKESDSLERIVIFMNRNKEIYTSEWR